MNEMKISKQLQKLKNLNVRAENCVSRDEAKKIISKAKKAQNNIKLLKWKCTFFGFYQPEKHIILQRDKKIFCTILIKHLHGSKYSQIKKIEWKV